MEFTMDTPQSSCLRVHAFEYQSFANGPGIRAVIWVQGCTLRCPGCFNPLMQPLEGGKLVEIDDLFRNITDLGDSIQGITLSGGEPLQQMGPVLALLLRIRQATRLSILVFTGYTFEEISAMERGNELLARVDVLIAGRYDASRRVAQGLVGSSNQSIHFLTGRYNPWDLDVPYIAEVIIFPEGRITISGIDPPFMK